jgi:hypothetical protein
MRRAALAAALTAVAALTAATACTEDVTAPGHCPDFCPSGSISGVDTVLQTVVQRDSAFRGFVRPHEASSLLAATLPGVIDSRAIFRTIPIGDSLVVESSTERMGEIVGVDSLKLALTITRRDTSAHNLTLVYYRLPLSIDSTTTFGGLGWTDSLRSLNVDSVYALAGHVSLRGDSVFVDTTTHYVTVIAKLDSAMAPFVPGDSGKVAFGVSVVAESRASVALGSVESGLGPRITWYAEVDSVGKDTVPRPASTSDQFDSFVFNLVSPSVDTTLDSTLAVGGMPVARSIMRFALPRAIRDSVQISRATLVLVTARPPEGVPADSFTLAAHGVLADFSAKSPLSPDASRVATTRVHIGIARGDTVRIEMTDILRSWQIDTLAPTTLALRQVPEGTEFPEIRFEPSTNTGLAPALHVTYVRRFPFGKP